MDEGETEMALRPIYSVYPGLSAKGDTGLEGERVVASVAVYVREPDEDPSRGAIQRRVRDESATPSRGRAN